MQILDPVDAVTHVAGRRVRADFRGDIMETLRIDQGELLLALSSHDLEHYLDLRTGSVIPFLEDMLEEEELGLSMEEEPERYRFIEPVASHEGFRWMEAFALQQNDERVRSDLLAALDRRRPFRGFKDALLSYPEVRTRWFAFEEERLMEYARSWLFGEDIEAELVVPTSRDLPPA